MNKEFPFFETIGTHYSVGQAIGRHFKKEIWRRIEWQRLVFPQYALLLAQCIPYFNATLEAFPYLIRELEGIADGSNAPLMELFLINNRDLFDPSTMPSSSTYEDTDRCTIVVGFDKQEKIIVGHNEDWASTILDFLPEDLYIFRVVVNGTTLFGLAYATEIFGDVPTMNSHGLIQCINEISTVSRIGVPKQFVARAVLECQTLDEAEKTIKKTDRASGFNHVVIQGDEVCNFETAGERIAIQKIRHKPFVHTNHYLDVEMEKSEKSHTESSIKRYKRAMEILQNQPHMTKEEIMLLLSDTKNSDFPICRPDATVASFVFVPSDKEVWICKGHPCSNTFVRYNICNEK